MFSTMDPLQRKVVCSAGTWNNHISIGHTAMDGNHNSVKSAIEEPEVIYRSSQTPDRDVYFARTESASYFPLFTKVVVVFNKSGDSGEVISAWPQKDISGGIDSGGLKYVKNKL